MNTWELLVYTCSLFAKVGFAYQDLCLQVLSVRTQVKSRQTQNYLLKFLNKVQLVISIPHLQLTMRVTVAMIPPSTRPSANQEALDWGSPALHCRGSSQKSELRMLMLVSGLP